MPKSTSEIVTTMKTVKTPSRTTTIKDATRETNVAPIMFTRVIATISNDANRLSQPLAASSPMNRVVA